MKRTKQQMAIRQDAQDREDANAKIGTLEEELSPTGNYSMIPVERRLSGIVIDPTTDYIKESKIIDAEIIESREEGKPVVKQKRKDVAASTPEEKLFLINSSIRRNEKIIETKQQENKELRLRAKAINQLLEKQEALKSQLTELL